MKVRHQITDTLQTGSETSWQTNTEPTWRPHCELSSAWKSTQHMKWAQVHNDTVSVVSCVRTQHNFTQKHEHINSLVLQFSLRLCNKSSSWLRAQTYCWLLRSDTWEKTLLVPLWQRCLNEESSKHRDWLTNVLLLSTWTLDFVLFQEENCLSYTFILVSYCLHQLCMKPSK